MTEYSLLDSGKKFVCNLENVILDNENKLVRFRASISQVPTSAHLRRNIDQKDVPIFIRDLSGDSRGHMFTAEILVE